MRHPEDPSPILSPCLALMSFSQGTSSQSFAFLLGGVLLDPGPAVQLPKPSDIIICVIQTGDTPPHVSTGVWAKWLDENSFGEGKPSPRWQGLPGLSWLSSCRQPQPGLTPGAFPFREARMGLGPHVHPIQPSAHDLPGRRANSGLPEPFSISVPCLLGPQPS